MKGVEQLLSEAKRHFNGINLSVEHITYAIKNNLTKHGNLEYSVNEMVRHLNMLDKLDEATFKRHLAQLTEEERESFIKKKNQVLGYINAGYVKMDVKDRQKLENYSSFISEGQSRREEKAKIPTTSPKPVATTLNEVKKVEKTTLVAQSSTNPPEYDRFWGALHEGTKDLSKSEYLRAMSPEEQNSLIQQISNLGPEDKKQWLDAMNNFCNTLRNAKSARIDTVKSIIAAVQAREEVHPITVAPISPAPKASSTMSLDDFRRRIRSDNDDHSNIIAEFTDKDLKDIKDKIMAVEEEKKAEIKKELLDFIGRCPMNHRKAEAARSILYDRFPQRENLDSFVRAITDNKDRRTILSFQDSSKQKYLLEEFELLPIKEKNIIITGIEKCRKNLGKGERGKFVDQLVPNMKTIMTRSRSDRSASPVIGASGPHDVPDARGKSPVRGRGFYR